MNKQVISKERVAEHGEVFTSQREVNAMLDLVKQETERIDSRFLEPACGTGNFLNEILRRKLQVVAKKYRRSQIEYERYAVLAVSSIYGIDIQEDNVKACRQRLLGLFSKVYTGIFRNKSKIACIQAVQFILSKNIIHGNALTLKTEGENQQPIIFCEWSFTSSSLIKRRDFFFDELLPDDATKRNQPDLFSQSSLVSDMGEKVFLPKETHSYPPIHFLRVGEEKEHD